MSEDAARFQIWGTFSVMDHLREGAFLAEAVLYDQLVIPVPPNWEQAETVEDRSFAIKELKRWQEKWNPERQRKLLDILKPIAIEVEWNRQRQQTWAAKYEESKVEAGQQFTHLLAYYMTGETLLNEIPAGAAGAVAVLPYDSLEDLEKDLGITKTSTKVERLEKGRGLPGDLVSVIVGREFLVPNDPDRDEYYLLKEAVGLVQEQNYREARSNFHAAQQKFIKAGKTDTVSVKFALDEMVEHLDTLHRLERKRTLWTAFQRVFLFGQMAIDALTATSPVVAAGKAAINLGQYTTTNRLKNPADPYNVRPYGALLLDAQRRLQLTLEGERRG